MRSDKLKTLEKHKLKLCWDTISLLSDWLKKKKFDNTLLEKLHQNRCLHTMMIEKQNSTILLRGFGNIKQNYVNRQGEGMGNLYTVCSIFLWTEIALKNSLWKNYAGIYWVNNPSRHLFQKYSGKKKKEFIRRDADKSYISQNVACLVNLTLEPCIFHYH